MNFVARWSGAKPSIVEVRLSGQPECNCDGGGDPVNPTELPVTNPPGTGTMHILVHHLTFVFPETIH